jgi:hypothetical protein
MAQITEYRQIGKKTESFAAIKTGGGLPPRKVRKAATLAKLPRQAPISATKDTK